MSSPETDSPDKSIPEVIPEEYSLESPPFTTELPMWEPVPGEPSHHYEWFHAYLMLGPARSLTVAYNTVQALKSPNKPPKTCPSGAFKDAALRWHWHARAVAFDEQKRKEAEAEYDASVKEAREQLRQRALNCRKGLLDKIEEMLTFPIGEVEQEADGKTTIIKPGRWSFDTTARLLMAQIKLDELDAPMGNAEVSVTVKSGEGKSVTVTVTPEDMSDEALAQIAAAGSSES